MEEDLHKTTTKGEHFVLSTKMFIFYLKTEQLTESRQSTQDSAINVFGVVKVQQNKSPNFHTNSHKAFFVFISDSLKCKKQCQNFFVAHESLQNLITLL